MDQFRDELLYASVKGKNPFKDVRVREAFALAVDAEALKSSTMRGQSVTTACLATAAVGCLAPELEQRPAADAARARRLLADAGYRARASRSRSTARTTATSTTRPSASRWPRCSGARASRCAWMRGRRPSTSRRSSAWTPACTCSAGAAAPPTHRASSTRSCTRHDQRTQKGGYNYGRVGDEQLDALIDAAGIEMNTQKRSQLIADAQRRVQSRYYVLPIHRQMITWAARRNVTPVVMPDNAVRGHWIRWSDSTPTGPDDLRDPGHRPPGQAPRGLAPRRSNRTARRHRAFAPRRNPMPPPAP